MEEVWSYIARSEYIYANQFLTLSAIHGKENGACRLKVTGAYPYSRNVVVTPGAWLKKAPASEGPADWTGESERETVIPKREPQRFVAGLLESTSRNMASTSEIRKGFCKRRGSEELGSGA